MFLKFDCCFWYSLSPMSSIETLSHSPEFELPDTCPQAPTDLIALIEEMHEGLHRVVVQKYIRRNKYGEVARIKCQDQPNRKQKPVASPEDIAEYCMMMMQYDIEKTDEPGKYKCVLYSGISKGQKERSKHVDLSDPDGEAKSVSMMSEGELVDQQQQYIGELHAQMVAVFETLHGMVKPLVNENREMMKVLTESVKRVGEVEAQRLRHDLELRIHQDEIKKSEAEEEHKMERWRELLGVVKKTKAAEKIFDAVADKITELGKKKRDDDDDDERPKKKKKKKKTNKKSSQKSSTTDSAKAKKKKPKSEPKQSDSTSSDNEEMTPEELAALEEKLKKEGMERMIDNPLVVAAETLRMSISEKKQWKLLRDTLSEEQMDCFDAIFDANSDEEILSQLSSLMEMKGRLKIMRLKDQLDETQTKVVEILLKATMEEKDDEEKSDE